MIHFTLYSRTYCHLCDDMLAALRGLEIVEPISITIVDVDADETLVAKYDELVPVLLASKDQQAAQQLCHYFLDEAVVRAFIAQA
ncbi:MAG: glutaredoxin family protein [Herminiimonas sp.]|uniref:glutaredoxin family protein n=1 Tax=Herminiimonas sp. TaxID=1926289 RepID=UPI00272289B4|nr:glutaredoxin family protein [Herminiimonas sp.]MDO9421375.1 glutaredoxin family protein [Herminiimonas sp.]